MSTNDCLGDLGIDAALFALRGLPAFDEANDLICAAVDANGRQYLLLPAAAEAWRRLLTAASEDGIEMHIVSAFRSVERQTAIIQRKLATGMPLGDVLQELAPPGFSEHHTGRAVDVGVTGLAPATREFERTEAFAWLCRRAAEFGFRLSYPKNNPYGFVYEPWHWCWHP
ncbi:MAG: D-alanyl-D-alanine carboxypeptidase [Betaproteobacteria bacterium ADurb.Bin341]|nr:MAG: D-alanyl-D-alanine carboxypeptidase [Betaproteobacteria bacterium ADurb.Bin341]